MAIQGLPPTAFEPKRTHGEPTDRGFTLSERFGGVVPINGRLTAGGGFPTSQGAATPAAARVA